MNNYQHLMVAVDFNESISLVIERAQRIAKTEDARVSLVHVVEPAPLDFMDQTLLVDIKLDDLLLKTARKQIQALAEKYSIDTADCFLEMGSVKTEIFKRVESESVDLLVVGSHGRHGLGLLMGSTANALLHGAVCDVLAVRVNE